MQPVKPTSERRLSLRPVTPVLGHETMEGTGHASPEVKVGTDIVMPPSPPGEHWLVHEALKKSIAVA